MKLLIRVVLILVLLVVVAAAAGFIMLDSIATAAVRDGAAYATQTDVECDEVDIRVFSSDGEINGLDIKNPDGPLREKFDSFMKLENGSAGVSLASVMSDEIVIPKVELNNIELSLVGLNDGTKNYEVILKSLKRFQGDGPPPEETKDQKKVVIKELIIHNITVKYDFAKDPAFGALPAAGTVLIADDEPMVLNDVGSGGVPMSEITAEIITDILVQVSANMAGDLDVYAQDLAGSLIDTVGLTKFNETVTELKIGSLLESFGVDLGIDIDGGLDKAVGDIVGDETGDLDEKIKEFGNDFGGLLGGDDEKKKKDNE